MSAMNIVYEYEGKLYINMTNRCTNKCKFCIRFTPSGVNNIDLWLDKEPTVEEIKESLIKNNFQSYDEVVFCGYGEPMLRWKEIIEVCKFIRSNTCATIRINTNGHANIAADKDVTPYFKELVDIVSISLNAKNKEDYNKICVCDYGEEGFDALLDFTSRIKNYVPRVILSIVDTISKEDIKECEKIAQRLGVEFRVREYSE